MPPGETRESGRLPSLRQRPHDMTMTEDIQKRRGREIPWLQAVRFHKDIVTRAEKSFFSLVAQDARSERWTSLDGFDPPALAGPWTLQDGDIRSEKFRLAAVQGQHDSLFLGGPCYVAWERPLGSDSWVRQWRPLLYREVQVRFEDSQVTLSPSQGMWNVSPLFFELVERLEVNPSGTLEDFAQELIEDASKTFAGGGELAARIVKALFRKVPGLEEELARTNRGNVPRNPPTPWILFAPATNFSALIRHLKRDYDRLEAMLGEDPANVGGLGLLEDRLSRARDQPSVDVAPFVPLNGPQRLAVQRILSGDPLTVVSGPPGTGKSQVVVAVLLNAWAQGKKVLFASNNNKAVDVIRERLERFESEFPIAVRAGSRDKQNILEVLRRTLNMAAGSAESKDPAKSGEAHGRRLALLEERQSLIETLDTAGPQRIEEAKRAALQSYAEHQQYLAELSARRNQIADQQAALGISAENIEQRLDATRAWLGRIETFKVIVAQDNRRRGEVANAIVAHEKSRLDAASFVGLGAAQAGDWSWTGGGLRQESLVDWESRFRSYVTSSIDQALDECHWSAVNDRWRDEADARQCSDKARELGEQVRRRVAETIPRLDELKELGDRVAALRGKLRQLDVPQDVALDPADLRAWLASYVELSTRLPKSMDWLPWSRKAALEKELCALEAKLRAGLPLSTWARVGQLNDQGRALLAPCLETALNWIELRGEWSEAQQMAKEIADVFQELRGELATLKYVVPPSGIDMEGWNLVPVRCDEVAHGADEAQVAWRRRTERETTQRQLRELAREGQRLGAGVPIRVAWASGTGAGFEAALRDLAHQPNADSLAQARVALYSGAWSKLTQCMLELEQLGARIADLESEHRLIPDAAVRIREWWLERPSAALVIATCDFQDWPSLDQPQEYLSEVTALIALQRDLASNVAPALEADARDARERAIEKLRLAVDAVPRAAGRGALLALVDKVLTEDAKPWPVSEISAVFAAFNPERVRARIDRLTADLERSAFEDAKHRWLQRLEGDDEVIRAVDALERSIRQRKGEVVEEMYATFRKALEAVPIWITTAQAAQAIPLQPQLFDLVVIDEASQCTLTNLLPLVYRARTLAVIGDEHQLPAIPTIQPPEELSLATKYNIEEFLGWIGHASVNVYGVAVESLPRRRADVLMLTEHFRSHPQIISFSNRYIYQQRLELKKDPNWGERLPVGSGVHSVPVLGAAQRGERGRSWVNPTEGHRVLELIKELRSSAGRQLSLGVVTPFAAQKEWLRKQIEPLGLASEVLVDTAYGFQGDERDIIIFSTVVAKGITESACKWVESPPNMVNVALTRAREALFVVSDFDQCLQQEGILRKLAQYCRDIQLLRDTSPAELELFSWMTVKGWLPRIHPRIGDVEVDFVLEPDGRDRIAIEVDGREHHEHTQEKDRARDAFLSAQGYQVLRIPARDVLQTPFDVIQRIGAMADSVDVHEAGPSWSQACNQPTDASLIDLAPSPS